ncbi:hypothetical protein M405DRAFT_749564, partial [Rhizopogon salebrosus TDB-379]
VKPISERLKRDWTSPVYAFYHPNPDIEYVNSRRCHVFKCAAKGCKQRICRFLDTGDAKSTGNLRKHVKVCWGEHALEAACETKNATEAQAVVIQSILETGSIKTSFERKGKGKVTYSHENSRPFEIVKDRGFQCLMKTGRPEHYIPSPATVSRDVRMVFACTRERIAQMLQQHDGELNFATDAWTSPNHRAFVAVTVHFEHNGQPLAMLLDIVEVPKVSLLESA